MKTLDVVALKQMINKNENFLLIDVREENEFESDNINGHLIPLGEIPSRISEIPKDKKVVIHCLSGVRSANAIHFLEQQHGYENLYNLEGGILAWNEANH